MDRSKIVVLAIVVIIAGGVGAWSWVNFYQTPDYDPEQAEVFAGHFFIHCDAAHPDEFCAQIIGSDHRDCFTDHLEPTPEDQVHEQGPVLYDRRTYLECMDRAVERRLSRDER